MVSLTNQARLLAAQEFNRRVIAEKIAKGKRLSTSKSRIGVLTGVKPRVVQGKVVGLTTQKSKTRLNTERLLKAEIKRQQELRSKESDLEKFLKNERRLTTGQVTRGELNRQIAVRKRKGLSKTPAQKRALQLFTQVGSRAALQARNIRKRARGVRPSQIQSADTLLGILTAEEARAGGLGSAPFADPSSFQFGGRSRAEVTRRGGTFGRRAGGESISNQLSFVSGARRGTATARIGFAQSLLSEPFRGAGSGILLGFVGSSRPSADPRKRARGARTQIQIAPPSFEQVLREGQGFFTTRAVPVTKPKLTKRERRQLVKARKAEDFAISTESRRELGTRPRQTGRTVDDLQRTLGAQLDIQNLGRAQREFGFGAPRGEQISVLGQQVIQPATTTTLRQQRNAELREQGFTPSQIRDINQGKKPRGKPITSQQRLALAQITQRETEALRAEGGLRAGDIPDIFGRESFGASGFGFGGEISLTPATGQPSRTETFGAGILDEDLGNIFNVNLSESLGIDEGIGGFGFGTTPTKKPTKKKTTKKKTKKTKKQKARARGGRGGAGGLGQTGGISLPFASTQLAGGRVTLGEAVDLAFFR